METEKDQPCGMPEDATGSGQTETFSLKRRLRLMAVLLLLLVLMALNLAIGSHKLMIELVVSGSMEPTLLVGDRILVDANAMPGREDIVVLKDPTTDGEKLVKRIVGMPGDRVRIENGKVLVNGEQERISRQEDQPLTWRNVSLEVPGGQVFVMGDNRNNSYDSLNFGPVPIEEIQGVVQATLWPPRRWGRPH